MKERAKAIAAIIVAGLLFLNAILTAGGHAPIPVDEDSIYETVSNIAAAVSILWCWWKNQNITAAAISAQNYLNWFKQEHEVVEVEAEEDDVETDEDD